MTHAKLFAFLSFCAFTLSSNCPSGWVELNTGCYKFIEKKASWHNAEKECKKVGGKLAIHIEGDLQTLINYAKRHHSDHSWWIGLSDIHREGSWYWTDGTYAYGLSRSSSWWGDRQPNNLKGNEDCAHLWHLDDMLLGDTRCSADMAWDGQFEFRPLCQYGSSPSSGGSSSGGSGSGGFGHFCG